MLKNTNRKRKKQKIQPVPTEDSTGEKVVKPSSSASTLTTSTFIREHSLPPKMGQPDNPLQRGSGKSKTQKSYGLKSGLIINFKKI